MTEEILINVVALAITTLAALVLVRLITGWPE